MTGHQRCLIYMKQRNWPCKTGDPSNGGNLNMAWYGMTPKQRRRWKQKITKAGY